MTNTGASSRSPYSMKPVLPLFALASIGLAAAEDLKLPEILAMPDGKQAASVEDWEKTVRPKTLDLFEEHVYGRSPAAPRKVELASFSTQSPPEGAPYILVSGCDFKFKGPKGELRIRGLLAQPMGKNPEPTTDLTTEEIEGVGKVSGFSTPDKPVPVFILLNNRSPELADLSKPNEFWPAAEIVKRGFATAIIHVSEIDPDKNEGFKDGVHAIFDEAPRQADSWGTIAAWAWGASRFIDGLDSLGWIDKERIAVVGHSRGGKAALWCGATDPRVALTISNDSGCTGAALSRRIHGETVADINKNFPHWFCENYKRYDGKEQELPVDQHQLIGLLAPRLAYVASASEDEWADPQGEFLSCVHAAPVYQLYGKQGLESDKMPEVGGHQHGGSIGYHIRPGKHNLTLVDWKQYMDFADRHWKRGE